MAEALGIAAAIVQLVDIGGRVLILSSRLCSEFKNVPGKMITIRREVRHSIDLLRLVDLDLAGGHDSAALSPPENLRVLADILKETIQQAKELAKLLEEISAPQGTQIKKAWNSIVSVKRQKEIMDRCQRLESLKSDLQLWYQHRIVAMTQQQMLV